MRKGRDGEKKKTEKTEKKREKKRKENTDENSGHYVIASSRLPERRPLERRTLVPISTFTIRQTTNAIELRLSLARPRLTPALLKLLLLSI